MVIDGWSFECANCAIYGRRSESESESERLLRYDAALTRSSWTWNRGPHVFGSHIWPASSPCAASPPLSLSLHHARADMSEGCDGNSICLSLTPRPPRRGEERPFLPSFPLWSLAWYKTAPPPNEIFHSAALCCRPILCITTKRRLFLMRGMQSGIDCRCLNRRSFVPSFEREEDGLGWDGLTPGRAGVPMNVN